MAEAAGRDACLGALAAYARQYPRMTPQDGVKFCYQSAYLGGHMIEDEAASLEKLRLELAETPDGGAPPFEYLCGHAARMNLSAPEVRNLPPEVLNRLFVVSAAECRRDPAKLDAALDVLCRAASNGLLPFGTDELSAYLRAYAASGRPAVHHSPAYRDAYRPHYRVVDAGFARLLPALAALQNIGRPAALCIDGRCASGKTTLARLLGLTLDAPVVHMDDFFLPPELRSPARLAEPGGNVHYERFAGEVLPHLGKGEAFSYRVFDCAAQAYNGARAIPAADLVVVEGAYAAHPAFGEPYALKLFGDVSPETQRARILARDGPERLVRFVREWIPCEENYIAALDRSAFITV